MPEREVLGFGKETISVEAGFNEGRESEMAMEGRDKSMACRMVGVFVCCRWIAEGGDEERAEAHSRFTANFSKILDVEYSGVQFEECFIWGK